MSGSNADNRFYGKYRGTVINNVDPEQRGRLMLTVPAVMGEPKGFLHRARVDVVLVTDGRVIDLNRIELPAGTPFMDRRFAPAGKGPSAR